MKVDEVVGEDADPEGRIETLTQRIDCLTEQIRAFWAAHFNNHFNALLSKQDAAELQALLDSRDEAAKQLVEWQRTADVASNQTASG